MIVLGTGSEAAGRAGVGITRILPKLFHITVLTYFYRFFLLYYTSSNCIYVYYNHEMKIKLKTSLLRRCSD